MEFSVALNMNSVGIPVGVGRKAGFSGKSERGTILD